MPTIDFYSKAEVKKIIQESIAKELSFVYAEIDKVRNRLNDIDEVLSSILKFKEAQNVKG